MAILSLFSAPETFPGGAGAGWSATALPTCIWLQQVTVGEADVVEHSAAHNDLWHKPHIHLQSLQENGPPSHLKDPEGPFHDASLTGSSCSELGGGCGQAA